MPSSTSFSINNASHHQSLPQSIGLLVHILNKTIARQTDEDTFKIVETLSKDFTGLNHQPNNEKKPLLTKQLCKQLEALDNNALKTVIRAFSMHFMLIDLAEKSEFNQKRKRIDGQTNLYSNSKWQGSFKNILLDCRARSITPQQMRSIIERLKYHPVFTAHPTEARRHTTITTLQTLYANIINLRTLLKNSPAYQKEYQLMEQTIASLVGDR